MLIVGIDVGQHGIKAVGVKDSAIASQEVLQSGSEANVGAGEILERILAQSPHSDNEAVKVVATGLGRKEVSFADLRRTQEHCVAKGAHFLMGGACTILDAGAGGCRAVRIGPTGKVLEFSGNSKCACGTGSFFTTACEVLQIGMDRLDELALQAEGLAGVSTTCAVFAESAIISNVHRGFGLGDICAGICDSVTTRLTDVVHRVGVEEELFFCGGVALMRTVGKMLEAQLGVKVHVPEAPLLVAALGAALSLA